MLAGFFASNILARHISKTAIRQWLLGTAAVSACVILLKVWL